ncbi:MAG TPA: hypothetical protein VFQ92_13330 [Blastocatellia bacterium]|nr:hypothetical protein [Blastocatellia bacterium]
MTLKGYNRTAKRRAALMWADWQPAVMASFEPAACLRIPSFLPGIMLNGVTGIEDTTAQQVADNSRFEQ